MLQVFDGDQRFNLRQNVRLAISIKSAYALGNCTSVFFGPDFIGIKLKSELKTHNNLFYQSLSII